jgi:putative protease
VREIGVRVSVRIAGGEISAEARSEDGRSVSLTETVMADPARNPARMLETVRAQLSKRTDIYTFTVQDVEAGESVPFLPASFLNGIRRRLAEQLDALPVRMLPLRKGTVSPVSAPETLTYKDNVANSVARDIYRERGAVQMEDAYELSHREGIEYMRTKYCLRHELGLCPKQRPGTRPDPLYLVNNGRRLRLDFDCRACEMTVR